MMLEIMGIRKSFEGHAVLEEINLRVAEGEFFSLLGPSGCGKTTLLRILAGLETATAGEIRLDGRRVDQLSPQARPFNMVFQKYALFPHLTVKENIAFGLKLKKVPAAEISKRCDRVLGMVGLSALASRRPETLSGGQQQRVAVARALVNEPKVLLLDEPLSALDQKMREHMQTELRALQKSLGLTFIYVTHDQEEAMTLSDRIGVMNRGHLEQVSAPREIYEQPRTHFTAQFVGRMSRLRGELVSLDGGLARLRLDNQVEIVGRPAAGAAAELHTGMRMEAFIRPEKIQILEEAANGGGRNLLPGRLSESVFKGNQTEVHVDVDTGGSLLALAAATGVPCAPGGRLALAFSPEDTFFFGESEG
ncbi:MAG: ABC transporter ATP-binding protein [Bdellovibrionaceae bacterium]|nr:ABC transporter ATP-binding protein [Pseudobdellovibrionaceae bacterium]